MPISVVMPALEMAQETGKLVAWLKKDGDSVRKGEPLLEVETDKAVLEVEAGADGVLAGISGEAGTDIPVGHVIAWILQPGESLPAGNPSPGTQAASVAAQVKQAAAAASTIAESAPPPQEGSSGRRPISPKARRLAKEHDIDLDAVQGSGRDGEVLASDVQAIVDAKGQESNPAATTKDRSEAATKAAREPLSAVARLMAERTTQSWTTVPHFFVQREVDATALNQTRAEHALQIENSFGVKLTHTDILVALVARTLARHPAINASWLENGIQLNGEIHVSLAMAVEGGVAAPVIRNASSESLGAIAKQRRELTDRARANRLRPADLAGGTFTISNLGMFHIDSFTALITPPQSAILAVGRIADRVVPVHGGIGVRPMLNLTLSSDHRVIDGARAATFLRDLADAIQEPERWLAWTAPA